MTAVVKSNDLGYTKTSVKLLPQSLLRNASSLKREPLGNSRTFFKTAKVRIG